MTFKIRGEEKERAREFIYLGKRLGENDNDRKCILAHLKKAKGQWWRMAKIRKRECVESYKRENFM